MSMSFLQSELKMKPSFSKGIDLTWDLQDHFQNNIGKCLESNNSQLIIDLLILVRSTKVHLMEFNLLQGTFINIS